MRFRNRLSFFLILLLLIVQAVTCMFVYSYARSSMIASSKEQLALANRSFLHHLDMLAERVATSVEVLALDYGLRRAIAEEDRDTTLSTLNNHGRRIGAERMMFIDLNARVQADTKNPEATGAHAPFANLLAQAEQEGSARALATLDGETSWIIVAPILAPTPVGYVAAFIPVDRALLDDMRRLDAAPVSIALVTSRRGGWGVLAISAPRADQFNLPQSFDPFRQDVTLSKHKNGEFLVSSLELPTARGSPPIFALHEVPLNDVLNSNWRVFGPLLAILLASVLAAGAGAYVIAQGVSRPLESLAAATHRIRTGDYHVDRSIAAGGEVGQLAHALADMAAAIDERERRLIETMRLRDEARDDERAKAQFIANMSHELRTPLNAIIGFGDIIHQQQLGPISTQEYVAFAGYICKGGRELLDLHNNILDIARIEAGKFDLRRDHFLGVELIEAALDDIQPTAESAGVALNVRRNFAPAVRIDGDFVVLRRAIGYVLHNAVKFTPKGGRAEIVADANGREARIVVRDTGIGMRPEDIDRLRRPFQRACDEYNTEHAGAGLGLSLTEAFLKLHGGVLVIESAQGAGTTVTMKAPIVAAAASLVDARGA